MESFTWNTIQHDARVISNPGARGYKTATPLTIAPFYSVAARTRLPLSIHPSIHPSIYPSTPRSIRLDEQQESSRLGIKFSSIPTLTFSSSTPGSRTGTTIELDAGRICHSCCVSGEGLARVPAAASVCVITVHDRWATIKKARYVHGGVSERVAPY